MCRRTAAPLVVVLLGLSCLGVPLPPAGLEELVDLPEALPRGAAAAAAFEADGDRAWDARDDDGMAEAARLAYWKAVAADPGHEAAYWKAARASALVGQLAEGKDSRADAFERGLRTAQLLLAERPELPEARYYYAINLGLLARERASRGHEAVKEMLPHLEAVAAERPDLEQAGARRALALVYLRAPGWPTSVGDEEAGLENARQAVEHSPGHPGNHLALAEALEAVGEPEGARQALDRAAELAATSGGWTRWELHSFRQDADRLARKLL